MSVIEQAKKELESKAVSDLVSPHAVHSATPSLERLITRQATKRANPELRRSQKDQMAYAPSQTPTTMPGQQQPMPGQQPMQGQVTADPTQMQQWVDSLSEQSLQALSDIVKKKLEAKQTPVQPTQQSPQQNQETKKGPF